MKFNMKKKTLDQAEGTQKSVIKVSASLQQFATIYNHTNLNVWMML